MEEVVGYVYRGGTQLPPVKLSTPAEVWNWTINFRDWADEIRIVNVSDDTVCLHVKSGKLIYPTKAEGMSPSAIRLFNESDATVLRNQLNRLGLGT
jgi:hypothetical protein